MLLLRYAYIYTYDGTLFAIYIIHMCARNAAVVVYYLVINFLTP